MREASAEYRCKPDTHRYHEQHRRARKTVMLERRRRIDEHCAVDGDEYALQEVWSDPGTLGSDRGALAVDT
jgi:hypothetical protein